MKTKQITEHFEANEVLEVLKLSDETILNSYSLQALRAMLTAINPSKVNHFEKEETLKVIRKIADELES
jgi:hypothetical protein